MSLPIAGRLSTLPISLLFSVAILASPACEPGPAQQPDIPVTAAIGETFGLAVGQTATILPEQITVTLTGYLRTRDCPANVSCVWSGQLIAEVAVTHRRAVGQLSAELNRCVSKQGLPVFESYNLALLKGNASRFYENFGKPGSTIRSINLLGICRELRRKPGRAGDRSGRPDGAWPAGEAPERQVRRLCQRRIASTVPSLVEDFRCPKSPYIACYTSGKATIQLALSKGGQNRTVNVSIPGLVQDTTQQLDRPDAVASVVDFAGYRIRLVSLDPFPTDPNMPKPGPEAYVATILVAAL